MEGTLRHNAATTAPQHDKELSLFLLLDTSYCHSAISSNDESISVVCDFQVASKCRSILVGTSDRNSQSTSHAAEARVSRNNSPRIAGAAARSSAQSSRTQYFICVVGSRAVGRSVCGSKTTAEARPEGLTKTASDLSFHRVRVESIHNGTQQQRESAPCATFESSRRRLGRSRR
jgi:hypothetical protein